MRAQDKRTDETGDRAGIRRPSPPAPGTGLLALQRAAGNAAVARAIEEQRHEHDANCGHGERPVQRSLVHDVLRSSGSPMDPPLRTEMETRFDGADFSGVRVHTDTAAQRSAAELEAKAYTSGSHVVSGADGMSKEDWAHELTHVLQQQQGPVAGTDTGSGVSLSHPADRDERAAVASARERMSRPLDVQRSEASARDTHSAARPEASATHVVQRAPTAGSSGTQSGKVTKSKGRGRKTGETVASLLTKELLQLPGWESWGASQSLTLHKVTKTEDPPEHARSANLGESKADKLYGDSGNLRKARTFTDAERNRQALRWISTIAFTYLNDSGSRPEEIQAAVAKGDDAAEVDLQELKLFISSNKDSVNETLRNLAAGQENGKEFVATMLESMVAGSAREKRHKHKLRKLLGETEVPPVFWDVVQALNGAVNVPPRQADKASDGMHAERRIVNTAGADKVSPDMIGGVKRPCVACYIALFQGTGRTPGPFWPSKSANVDVANYSPGGVAQLAREIDRAVTAAGGTYASLQVNCGGDNCVSWAADTDSDSPASASDSDSEHADAMDTSS